jgi:hypothetical protein
MAKLNVDLEEFKRDVKEGGAKKTYIAFAVDEPGYEAVMTLKSRGYDVKAVVAKALEQVVAQLQ